MRNLELVRPLVLRAIETLTAVRCSGVNVDAGHIYCVCPDRLIALDPESAEVGL